LAAALAAARAGAQVTVLEQAPEIAEVGAGIQISPNGWAVLKALGLDAPWPPTPPASPPCGCAISAGGRRSSRCR
jgi:2-polyprenyl-6-methoxyphenol hydroxylase-like FAD-dependent oxidoreductase